MDLCAVGYIDDAAGLCEVYVCVLVSCVCYYLDIVMMVSFVCYYIDIVRFDVFAFRKQPCLTKLGALGWQSLCSHHYWLLVKVCNACACSRSTWSRITLCFKCHIHVLYACVCACVCVCEWL